MNKGVVLGYARGRYSLCGRPPIITYTCLGQHLAAQKHMFIHIY